MTKLTQADLDYLRNIKTSPPNAGRSIDSTKPGPDADRIATLPEPQDVRGMAKHILGEHCACFAEAYPAETCDKMIEEVVAYIEGRVPYGSFAAAKAALSQSDARICLDCDLSGESHAFDSPKQACELCEHHERLTVEAVNRAFKKAYESRKEHSDAQPELDELRLIAEENADNIRLLDYISDKIGLPHDEELSQENFGRWFSRQSDAQPDSSVTFWYQNYRGEISRRVAAVIGLRWGSSEYHKEPQWLLRAFDLEKEAEREFAVKDMAPTRDALSYTAPHSPDASGLIEAAEWHEEQAAKCDADPSWRAAVGIRADYHREDAAALRARAADKSAPRSDKGGA